MITIHDVIESDNGCVEPDFILGRAMTEYMMRKKRLGPSPAALQAALASRRSKAALPKNPNRHLTVVAVRSADGAGPFAWEIRRFGAIVLASSEAVFDCETAAVAAGTAELAKWPAGAVGPPPGLPPARQD
jgi:hypothetical protein